jgi:hypothetical protein
MQVRIFPLLFLASCLQAVISFHHSQNNSGQTNKIRLITYRYRQRTNESNNQPDRWIAVASCWPCIGCVCLFPFLLWRPWHCFVVPDHKSLGTVSPWYKMTWRTPWHCCWLPDHKSLSTVSPWYEMRRQTPWLCCWLIGVMTLLDRTDTPNLK